MRKKSKISVILASVLILCIMLLACGNPAETPPSDSGQGNTKDQDSNSISSGATLNLVGSFDQPQAIHSNPWAPPGQGTIGDFMYVRLFDYLPRSNQYLPRLGESFEEQGNKTIVHLRKNVTWSDGKPFTSKDVITTYNIGFLAGWPVWRYVDTIEAPDDYTVVFNWKAPGALNKPVAFNNVISSPAHIYGKWADEVVPYIPKRDDMGNVDDATSQELSKIREDLYNFKPAITEAVVVGPFICTNVTSSEATMKKNDKFYAADNVKFENVKMLKDVSNEATWAAIMAGQVDMATNTIPKEVKEEMKAKVPGLEWLYPSDYSQFCIVFNTRLYPMSETNFRKAVAYALDREPVQQVTDYYAGLGDTYSTGILPSQMDNWLTKDFLSKLENYTYNSSKAEELLKEMGWSKGNDGFWRDNKGNLVQLELSAPAGYSDWVLGGEAIADQLNKFGLKVEFRAMDNDAYWKYLDQGQHQMGIDFLMCMWGYGHPWTSYNQMFHDSAARLGLIDPQSSNKKLSMSIKLNYSGETVDPYKLIDQLALTEDMDKQKQIVEKLAAASNQLILGVPFAEKQLHAMFNSDKLTGYPKDPNDPIYFWGNGPAQVKLIIEGKLQPKDK